MSIQTNEFRSRVYKRVLLSIYEQAGFQHEGQGYRSDLDIADFFSWHYSVDITYLVS
ncbi:MAG: hypothetical protein ACXACD_12485 [Candidatus Thorarchaeota archaeon]